MTCLESKPDLQFSTAPQGPVFIPFLPVLGLLSVKGSSSWQRLRTWGDWAVITVAIATEEQRKDDKALSLNLASLRLCQEVNIILPKFLQRHC